MNLISRKQGMKGGSVQPHVTDWNDTDDKKTRHSVEQKGAPLQNPQRTKPLGIHNGNLRLL